MIDAGRSSHASAIAPPESRSLQMPSRPLLWHFVRETAWVTCLWFVVYGGANWLTRLHDYRVRLWTEVDLAIPFVPAAAMVYLSLFPMLWISPIVLRSRGELHSFAKALTWLIMVSGIGFLLLPGDKAFPEQTPDGFVGELFTFADRMNMSFNYLPSLHVGMAVVCAYAYSRTVSRSLVAIFWLWAAAIALSTLLTHQHYVADVASGGVLGLLVATICKSQSR
jgi:membrane-associated phospholipid phosphatase